MKNKNAKKQIQNIDALLRFPSPCGEKVMKNQKDPDSLPCHVRSNMFPSPCGEKVMKNLEQARQNGWQVEVEARVSIPLRGKGYEKRQYKKGLEDELSMFPSPCGEKVMKND